MKEEQNQLSSLAETRGALYCALALGFSTPTARNLREISRWILEVLQKAKSLPVGLALQDELQTFESCVNAADRTSLMVEYHRLFVGPYRVPAPPYASVYIEPKPTVMGPSTLEVLRMYKEVGFLLSPSYKDLPDHIAVEFEFMALLCEEEGAGWERSDLSQAAKFLSHEEIFLKTQLVRWIPNIASKILASTSSPFYRSLVSLARDYVSLDLDFVRALGGFLKAKTSGVPTQEGESDGD